MIAISSINGFFYDIFRLLKDSIIKVKDTFLALFYDFKFGIQTTGSYFSEESIRENMESKLDSKTYVPTYYSNINKIISHLKLHKNDIFIDLGCGKGRVVFMFSRKNIKQAIGVEINKLFFKIAEDNLKRYKYKNKSEINFFNIDASKHKFSNETIIFMRYPFSDLTMKKISLNLKKSLKKNPRNIRIISKKTNHLLINDINSWIKYSKKIPKANFYVWKFN